MEGELQDRISELAHGLWQTGGDRRCRPLDDWLIAEQMVVELMTVSQERPHQSRGQH